MQLNLNSSIDANSIWVKLSTKWVGYFLYKVITIEGLFYQCIESTAVGITASLGSKIHKLYIQ